MSLSQKELSGLMTIWPFASINSRLLSSPRLNGSISYIPIEILWKIILWPQRNGWAIVQYDPAWHFAIVHRNVHVLAPEVHLSVQGNAVVYSAVQSLMYMPCPVSARTCNCILFCSMRDCAFPVLSVQGSAFQGRNAWGLLTLLAGRGSYSLFSSFLHQLL